MKVVKKILDGFVKAVSVSLMCLVAGIVLLMLNELFLRNFLDKSFRGMTELAGFMFLWMAFLGIIVLYDQNRLISLDMIYVRTKEPVTTIFWFLHKVIALCLGVIMVASFVGLYPYVSTEYFSSMPHFAKVWQYLPLAIAGGFLCIKSVYEIIEKIRTLRNPEQPVLEVAK
ncbi:TRAP-type C4-dicarboxylate transport system, small permease component [Sphaerochaeta pleomorpha str. Grapes]|uniref:TRAP-type C4-dicarboxylate transport system, small permease component n=1 Tax=Sphaerochaeta pleomorpha (strain ATCC BAA-1885 / DSM 22778 / Grapes) TaxID=158190 RepID=G8QTV7_SPHPG|nr:TRAP transporter small permease [Sphaerochaeta pleomorpha]AEV29133.1 TRAP-type C4-dicarboxylate transport system, small permease component [Sphaerochaeta pleomorpha str. Grapes]